MSSLLLVNKHRLAWNEYGLSDGSPVFYFHGAPGSSVEPEPASGILLELGMRLIVPERPGYGQSTPQEDFSLESWAETVSELSRHMQLRDYSIIGYSAGGPYAIACGYFLAESVKNITVVSSLAPFDSVAMQNHINAEFKPLYELCASDYDTAKEQIAQLAISPEVLLGIMEGSAAPVDRCIFALNAFHRQYLKNMSMALASGVDGIVGDLRNLALPWPFEPEQIRSHVNIWHGHDDKNVGIAVGEYLAERLKNASTFYLKQAGHFFLFEQWRNVLKQHIDTAGGR